MLELSKYPSFWPFYFNNSVNLLLLLQFHEIFSKLTVRETGEIYKQLQIGFGPIITTASTLKFCPKVFKSLNH